MRALAGLIAVAAMSVGLSGYAVADDAALHCQLSKMDLSAEYGNCRLKADARSQITGRLPDYSKCNARFFTRWHDVELQAGPTTCQTEGDVAPIGTRISRHTKTIQRMLTGEQIYVQSTTLASPHLPATGQSVIYGVGDDGDLQSGTPRWYRDNGVGTVSDLVTGLVWEKKVISGPTVTCTSETGWCANPHAVLNTYAWTDQIAPYSAYNGPVVTIFLEQLNNRCSNDVTVTCSSDGDCTGSDGPCGFAGHRDWRLPNVSELRSIIDYGKYWPSVDPVFNTDCGSCLDIASDCSCTGVGAYWSSTSASDTAAVPVYFQQGAILPEPKYVPRFARAVRSGP